MRAIVGRGGEIHAWPADRGGGDVGLKVLRGGDVGCHPGRWRGSRRSVDGRFGRGRKSGAASGISGAGGRTVRHSFVWTPTITSYRVVEIIVATTVLYHAYILALYYYLKHTACIICSWPFLELQS
jgi:hypothetical protein